MTEPLTQDERNVIRDRMPTVHLNGTGRQTLIDDRDAAWNALRDAYDVLKKIAPNMRDYYCREDGTAIWQQAEDQHRDRLQRLARLADEIEYEIDILVEGE